MKIGFDAKRILYNKTGLGNYSRFVVNSLSTHFPNDEYKLYSPGKGVESLHNQINPVPSVSFRYPNKFTSKLFPSLWRSNAIVHDLKEDQIDLFHGLSNELPLSISNTDIPSVVTIHDLIFIHYPQFYKYIDRSIYNYKFKKACQAANRIIAISDMTKNDIIETYKITEEKIVVVYQGCDKSFQQTVTQEKKEDIRKRYNIPSHYILYVGSIEERKNLLLIVRALHQLNRDIHLIAIGKRTPYTDIVEAYIQENHIQQQVSILNNIPFEDLPGFYQMADLFIYPSFFEGFGIPIIEALHSNVPVIAATGSCLEEAGGPDSLYVEPNDVNDLSEKIFWVLSTPSQANLMKNAGKEYVKRFTDQQIADDLMEVYRNILNK
ncbi:MULTISPECIES: glycosyltransferase family 1 protein [Parabacteroides]|uniref:glycosyltransferase family 4 protein n=1 Tax=Parabacteroides leei TaxID=2939491 RepID=UPI00189C2F60|nr:glycosyltransferase family 1 protein [Parabacteroides goldsteinii]